MRVVHAPKRILMCNLVDFGTGDGGAGHQAGLLKHFLARGHEVHMLTPARPGAEYLAAEFGARVCFTPSTRGRLPAIADALWQLPYIVHGRFSLRARTLYVRVHLLSVLQVLLGRLLGMRVVVEHNSWASSERRARGARPWLATLEYFSQVGSARFAHCSRSVTSHIAGLLIAAGCSPARGRVIGNGADLELYRPLPAPRGPRLRLGFLGQLSVWQGVDTLLEAMQLLRDDPRFECVIAGDGPEATQLRAAATALGLDRCVRFLGHVDSRDAPALIGSFDIALAPYTRKRNDEIGSSAVKIRHYAACGRPVIAARLPGIEELAEHGWLFLHEPDDPADLARAIRALAAFDQAALDAAGRSARAHAEQHFDWRTIADQVLDTC